MLKRRVISGLCAAVLLLSAILSVKIPVRAEQGLDLSQMQVVLPVDDTAVEGNAATELKSYLFNMTEVSLKTVKEGTEQGPCIYVGNTEFAKENGVTYPIENDPNGEAWAIQVVGQNLVLCGAPTRGVLYAVYHLLEDVLGVRWWNVWEEYIPKGPAIVPENYADSGVPAMEYREVFVGVVMKSDYTYYLRNRMNGNFTNIPTAYGGKESYGPPAHTHTFNRFFPKNFENNNWMNSISDGGDFTTNPEWFAVDETGKRVYNGHLCLSNPQLQEEFATRLIGSIRYDLADAQIQRKESAHYFSVVPPDSNSFCKCDECAVLIEEYGLSGYILDFVNKMANAVTEAGYTEVLIEMEAYSAYKDPPSGGIVPAENVLVRFADSGKDILHGVNHPNNAATLERMQTWSEITTNKLYYWQYVVNYNNNGVFPSMFYYGDEMTTAMEMGFTGWFAEQEHCINADFWDMKQWLLAKLMEEPVTGQAYADLMDEFIYGYYGQEAGGYIRQYLYHMHEKAEQTDTYQNFGTHIIGTNWLSVEDIITGYGYFEQAFAAAGNDATVLRRLRSARSGFDRVIFENYGKWQTQAEEAGLTLPFTKREVGERLDQTFTEQIAFRGDYDIDYEMFCYRYDMYSQQRPALPEELSHIPQEHILEFNIHDFRLNYGDVVVTDSDSPAGKAIRSKSATRAAAGNNSLLLQEGQAIPVAVYDPDKLSDNDALYVGSIPAEQIQVNQGYQLYRLQWTVPPIGANSYLYIFSDWGVQNTQLPTQVQDMVGQTVEICISMKVEGVLNGSDPDNYPVYYIDRIFVVPSQENWEHQYAQYPGIIQPGQCKMACTICGDVVDNLHNWDDGTVTKKPTAKKEGEKTFTCTICGAQRTLTLDPATQSEGDYTLLLVGSASLLLAAALVVVALTVKKRRQDSAPDETQSDS